MKKRRTLTKFTIFFVGTISFPLMGSISQTALTEEMETHAIVSHLKVYQTYDVDGPVSLSRIGRENDGGYVIPELAIKKAEVVIGYGISDDISFEESATAIYGKPSYGFDCTSSLVQINQPNCYFIPSCIVSKHLEQNFDHSGSFDQHLEMIGAKEKKVFVKMDIEGNEYETVPDILDQASNVTGIVLEVHFIEQNQVAQLLSLLERLDENFLLVHLHANNCCGLTYSITTSNSKGSIPRILELTYINKNLISHYEVSPNQSHPTPLDMPNIGASPEIEFTILE